MQQILLIFLGGGLGSICRYGVSHLVPDAANFFYGTFATNVLSSLILGIIVGLAIKNVISGDLRLFFITGFCGGFSTFSTFSAEILQLFETGNHLSAFTYITVSILTCVLCIFMGMKLTAG